jgi:hypothetical protein
MVYIFTICPYGICSVALNEEYDLKKCQNKMLWRIFGAKRNKVAARWMKLSSEILFHILIS